MGIKVRKKDGSLVDWNINCIELAVRKASAHSDGKKITDEELEYMLHDDIKCDFLSQFEDGDIISTNTIHQEVLECLKDVNEDVYLSYKAFRNYKQKDIEAFNNAKEFAESVINIGDKENANKDSALNSTKQTLIAEGLMRELMLNYELEPEWVKAHEEGWIHIHDLAQRYSSQINCCLFDIGNLLKGGFQLNGTQYIEPKGIQTAWAVAGDVTLSASSNQLGGFTLAEIDKVLAPYAESSYQKHLLTLNESLGESVQEEKIKEIAYSYTVREIEQGYQGFETKLNTISNSLAQVPFVTATFGLGIGYWEKKISEIILKTREKGMGENAMTAVFPKLVFLSRKDVNRNLKSPNYDLYLKAIECSRTRLYPDYLSLDEGNLAEVYERSGKAVSPMGK